MKYNFNYKEELFNEDFRNKVKYLESKEKETKFLKIIPNSHKEIIQYLREFNKNNPELNSKIIDAIEKYDRTEFFYFFS